MTATITTKNWRGTYVARLSLTDRGTFDREWAEISKVRKSIDGKKVQPFREYSDLAAGWYETREGYRTYHGELTVKVYYRVDGLTAAVVPLDTVVASISGPLPGVDGEWGSDRCECGGVVDGFTVDGFPHCDEHGPHAVCESDNLAVPL